MDAEAWYQFGNARQEKQEHEAAVECYERALAMDAAHARAWNNLGVSLQALGQGERAAGAYRAALEKDAGLAQALLNLAYLHVQHRDYRAAEPLFERIVAVNPGDAQTWCALGALRNNLGRPGAAEAFRGALAADAKCREAYQALAEMSLGRGDAGEAIQWLTAGLANLPGEATFLHLLSAASGETTARPPEGHVQAMFDSMANDFDRHLVHDLSYRVPEALAATVMPWLQANRPARVIDLGCGTGLVGAALAGSGAEVTGIDVSAEMLRRAAARGAYAHLVQGDMVSELERHPAGTHAILAADVFIYLGDLQPVFAAAAKALAPGGRFAFSLEHLPEGKFLLQRSGRYAQSVAYVRDLAAGCGLEEESMTRTALRREGTGYSEGWLACFRASAASGSRC